VPGWVIEIGFLVTANSQAAPLPLRNISSPAMARVSRMARALAVLMVAAFGMSAVSGELRCCSRRHLSRLCLRSIVQCFIVFWSFGRLISSASSCMLLNYESAAPQPSAVPLLCLQPPAAAPCCSKSQAQTLASPTAAAWTTPQAALPMS
jgi:hypothetical protein